ncbi:MAG: penicillin-binding protein 1A [Candidatus Dormibacteria bacterium]
MRAGDDLSRVPSLWERPPQRRRDARRRGASRPPRGPGGRGGQSVNVRLVARVLAGGAALMAGVLGFLTAYAALSLPDVNSIGKQTGTIRFVDVKGRPIAELGTAAGDRRSTRQLSQIAPILQRATIATEDRGFYDEGAINASRVLKALLVDVLARRASQGASTITQQLAKQAFLPQDKTALRKLREALLANQLDARYTKDQILELYLNVIFYGHGAYGIQDAAQTYFGKDAGQLSLAEASLLAGLPNAPSLDDPFQNPAGAFSRQHVVLSSMVQSRDITAAQAADLDPISPDPALRSRNQGAMLAELRNGRRPQQSREAPHFLQFVRNELAQRLRDQPSAFDESLTVTTTLDLDDQHLAESSVDAGVARLSTHHATNGALVMLDTSAGHEGEIRAMVGSRDYGSNSIDGQFNVVTAERRPGSSFKPFVYEQAFRSGRASPDSTVDDTYAESQRLGGVQDFDRRYMGRMTAARALLLSRNIPTEQTMAQAGVQQTIDFATSLGITSRLEPNLSTAIGSSAVRMIDEAEAYGAFATGGHRVHAHSIRTVVESSGNVLVDATQRPVELTPMSDRDAYKVTAILRGYASQWNIPMNRPTAGKSGTTDNFVDAWYMAYAPNFVVGSWVGNTAANQPGELPMDSVYGTDVARAVTAPFVNRIGLPVEQFRVPAGAGATCYGNCAAPGDNGKGNGNDND